MKKIKHILWLFPILISLLWFATGISLPTPFNYFDFRDFANQYSGLIAMGAMSLCMILALRLKWLDKYLNGLDKAYRLHKWLGIVALIATLTHYWFTQGTKWLVGLGILERPVRNRPPLDPNAAFSIEQWLNGLRGAAEGVGEWAFYLALVLMVIALVKRIPYHWFKKCHTFLAVSYLLLVFHAAILIKFPYWKQPIGWLMAVLMFAGSYAAMITLLNGIGKKARYQGKVVAIKPLAQMQSVELTLAVENWQGHQAGQFVFLRSAKGEAHPFTIASAWQPSKPHLRFVIKQLGDYTQQLAQHFPVGQQVEISGPYGNFNFQDNTPEQIWIAAGVGITPFMAALEQGGFTKPITLYYSYHNADPKWLNELKQRAEQANVTLILWHSQTQGRLTATTLKQHSPNIAQAGIWFCGSSEFARQLLADGLLSQHFHQELFEMR